MDNKRYLSTPSQPITSSLGLDVDGMCDDHGSFGCPKCKLPMIDAPSYLDLQTRLDAMAEALRDADDTLKKLAAVLVKEDAALFAQEIAVIKQQRMSIAAHEGGV